MFVQSYSAMKNDYNQTTCFSNAFILLTVVEWEVKLSLLVCYCGLTAIKHRFIICILTCDHNLIRILIWIFCRGFLFGSVSMDVGLLRKGDTCIHSFMAKNKAWMEKKNGSHGPIDRLDIASSHTYVHQKLHRLYQHLCVKIGISMT